VTSLLFQASYSALNDQQIKSWQQFYSLHSALLEQLNEPQLLLFKRAIALSDFVLKSALQMPSLVVDLFKSEELYQLEMPNYQQQLQARLIDVNSEQLLHQQLRIFRLKSMVSIAVADFLLDLPLDASLARLSNLADNLIIGARDWLTLHCQEKWGTPIDIDGDEQPLLVYGMGKLGGQELNFSSDIDLIFVYPETGETQGVRRSIENQLFFTRLGQKLITALNQQTSDGFVYRVDMRLRPFGESGPLVMTFNAMENYYQDQGRDWERYAMLKARLIGEGKYHGQLSSMLRPFVYRRYIDFSVIESLRRMKSMIAQEVRRKQLSNNIKLGAGGIREVEFIVQVFQMIRGGRVTELQHRNLLAVLPRIVTYGEISAESADVLQTSYRFLRRVENIIQAINDQQTQTLPDNCVDQQRILTVLQCKQCQDWPAFLATLARHMSGVHQQFLELIGEESPNNQALDQYWVTLWDSQWSDEESIAWVAQTPNAQHSYEQTSKQNNSVVNESEIKIIECTEISHWNPSKVWHVLSDFRDNINKRSMGNRGRQVLDKLVPVLIWHIEHQQFCQQTLARVLSVLDTIATRTAYIELLFENEGALKHLIRLCHNSSWVAEHIAKFPVLLDELIDPKLFLNPPTLASYKAELREGMLRIPEDDQEAQMVMLRQFKQVKQLRIAAADISNVLPIKAVSDHLTALAEAIIEEVANLSWLQLSARFGVPKNVENTALKGFAVIGYGKLGGFELGYSSDLDLVFVHTGKVNDETNGTRVIPVSQFYLKLAQRMLHLFNTRMANGILYELDMRLRPSGNAGLLMVHVETFGHYQAKDAWTWEHQALVRARLVYGHEDILQKFKNIKQAVLCKERDTESLRLDVINMRNKMRVHLDKSNDELLDIKQGGGGLVDIEFLVQFLVLKYSATYRYLTKYSDNISLLEQCYLAGIISELDKSILVNTYCQLRDFGHHATLRNQAQLLDKKQYVQQGQQIIELIERLM
jgi:glutamate-ammonia-ligase adenylyltransferase